MDSALKTFVAPIFCPLLTVLSHPNPLSSTDSALTSYLNGMTETARSILCVNKQMHAVHPRYAGRGGSFGVHGFGPSNVLNASYAYVNDDERPSTGVAVRATLACNADGLWHDQPQFRVVLQAVDSESRVPFTPQTLFARVVPPPSFQSALQAAGASQSAGFALTCATSVSQGVCTVTFSLPSQWFLTDVAAANVSVQYGIGSGVGE
jgi:hypothetical protein